MSSKKKGNRSGWDPQDDVEYEMAKSETSNLEDQVDSDESAESEPEPAMADENAVIAGKGADEQLSEREEKCSEKEKLLDCRENDIASREATLSDRENAVSKREGELSLREASVEDRETEADKRDQSLLERENAVREAELDRDEGYRASKSQHDKQLLEDEEKSKSDIALREKEALATLQKELSDIRAKHDEALKEELEAARASIASERRTWKEEYERQSDALSKERAELDKQRGALDAQQSELDRKTEDFDLEQLGFERQRKRFENHIEDKKDSVDSLVEERVAARKEEFEAREQESRDERARLLQQLSSQERLLASFEELQKQLGGRSPQSVLAELEDLRGEISRLNEEIAAGTATQELTSRLNRAISERDAAYERIQKYEEEGVEERQRSLAHDRLSFELEEAKQKLEFAERIAKNSEGEVARLSQELDRYQAAYEKPKAREERIAEIEKPFFALETHPSDDGSAQSGRPVKLKKSERPNELDWLNGIYSACEDYGLHFNPRLLKAFHTSLKTAEWSPLTVLAGVSGTGKSELPRLYSHFGGLYFASVAVQPNWDSKESMLGFFNSIDNRFDAESILRFLAQSQKDWMDGTGESEGYPGLSDAVCMILLDEMNLAHPELYFAEFLSKFEERRGRDRDHLPAIDVKIGTGMTPYQIPLGRNMLWTGTMNQDETTKSLSDKVLDRSIVMNFPRPTELKRRKQVNSLDESNRGEILHINTWNSWKVAETDFAEEEILPYKKFVEEMNDSLGVVGRAIGHRVWQSVEYYMASYPDVRLSERGSREWTKAMHLAFEDQIVQKIMPKLRGIDTTGESQKKCLAPIKNLLLKGVNDIPFNLGEDFDLACKLDYGQFVWQSANYLKEEELQDGEIDSL